MTGVAFDNFDRFVDTASGKDTLHHTVGIAYQKISEDNSTPSVETSTYSEQEPPARKRRAFEAVLPDIAPYPKKSNMLEVLLPINDKFRMISNESFKKAQKLDLLWLLSHFFQVPKTPMWVGFNSRVTVDLQPRQKVCYLTPINSSPTDKSVVAETLRQSLKIAEELRQGYIQVTYDLDIAKVALEIQSTEKPLLTESSFIWALFIL
ncbi:unnamed protein product [Bemisia tabaci]|uniref:Uncharacterized protein n=1 Tax=Bemisia tabaci TaxID=7038 RepID=A0A9P0ALS6_BEMTA|nr:unnamed protein product [Bemisia tabaci]